MKIKNYLTAGIAAAVGLLILTGCSDHRSSAQVHELTFSLEGISEVILSYDEEPVTFYESETNDLVVKEYMTESRCSYYAKADHGDNYIAIREGRKPLFGNGFSRRVAVYLPAFYHESLTVTTTDGDIDLSALEMTLHTLRIDSTAGAVKISTAAAQTIHLSTTSGILEADRLEADTIQIATTRGSFSCRTLDGHVTYTTTSGNANIQSAIGSGIYEASHAEEVTYEKTNRSKTDPLSVFGSCGSRSPAASLSPYVLPHGPFGPSRCRPSKAIHCFFKQDRPRDPLCV